MYIPKHFEETDVGVLHSLIRSHPLGAWVTQGPDGLVANHIPFLLHPDRGAHGTLVGHVARANSVWKNFSRTCASLIIFQGPEAYISPSWYPSKHENGKVVPTWDYAVVHAHGMPTVTEDRGWLLKHVSELTSANEASEAAPWKVTDAPPAFIESMLALIVGVEIPISSLEGKWKVSQNRSTPDKAGAIAGLKKRSAKLSSEVAELVEQRSKPRG